MTWADFYLICFVVGFAFSFLSFLMGGLHWHGHFPHMPHFHGLGHGPVGGGHLGIGHGPVVGGHAAAPGAGHVHAGPQISPFNFMTIAAFLAWFGGTGYLLTRFSSLWLLIGIFLATVSGLVGAAIVFLFMTKILMSAEENMDPADYEMVGVLGKVSSSIREGGTGEIIYSQVGTRRTCGARSEDNSAITKGEEIVVTRYEKGIAYVRRWEELAGEEASEKSAKEQ
jgi:hypothetical protein